MAQKTTTATLCCLKTETELANIAGGLYTSIQRDGRTFGTAAALEDNTGNSLTTVQNIRKAMPDGTNGVKADIKFAIPECGETADTVPDFDCSHETPSNLTYGYEEFYFDNGVGEKFTVREDLFDVTCEDPKEELARKLAYHVESMYTKYNRKLTENMVANVGSLFHESDPLGADPQALTNVTPGTLKLFRPAADGASIPQPMAIYDLIHQYERMNPSGGRQPVLIGGSKALGAYRMGSKLFGGNVDGNDPADMADPLRNAYIDWQLPSVVTGVIAANPLLSFLPGAVELVEFWKYDNPNKRLINGRVVWAPVKASNLLVRQKVDVGTAILGRPFIVDMQIYYDECNNQVTYTLRKDFDLFHIPSRAFCPGTTWNYNQLWDVTCEAYNCADVL